ncbi:MAG TPA: carboxypeptidase regulatory-like domain-containing protein [Nostocaceae cyanobacterium]|nr:carboxypeptidase regulatory-like domain-containing protein [Nostocaceae cyanobacterium]
MLSQAAPPLPPVTTLPPESSIQAALPEDSTQTAQAVTQHSIVIPSPPETLPSQFSTARSPEFPAQELTPKTVDSEVTAQLPVLNAPTGHTLQPSTPVISPAVNGSGEVESAQEKSQQKVVAPQAVEQPVSIDAPTHSLKKITAQVPTVIPTTAPPQASVALPDRNNSIETPTHSLKNTTAQVPTVIPTTAPPQTPVALPESNKNSNFVLSSSQGNLIAEAQNLLVGVIINGREVGSLELLPDGNKLLIPLADFAQLTGITIENIGDRVQLKTPLGEVTLSAPELQKIKGITYVSDTVLKEKLLANLDLKVADLTLTVDLPWQRGTRQATDQVIDLQAEVKPPSSGLSNLRQELRFFSNSGNTNWFSSTLLGGRLAGGSWRVRVDNNFENQPNLSEYFFFKRSGQFLYQIGKQQFALNPLLSGLNLTGLQFGYTNLPADRFTTSYSATELLPRRSQPLQTFRGVVPPASFVQLRIGGAVIAQQQVGLSGEYDFREINLPIGQTSDLELYVYDRSNLNVPTEIRSLSLNSSDLLLPAGGNVQLAGAGVTGNYLQNSLFEDFNSSEAGRFASFYQVRQGLSDDFTVEAGVQLLPDIAQAQAGFAWRLASPLILSANVGVSGGDFAYKTDLDFQLKNLRVLGSSEFFPGGYLTNFLNKDPRDRYNHSLDARYKFGEDFTLGVIARTYQNQSQENNYVLPTFYLRPIPTLSLRGSPNYAGTYSLNATYVPNNKTRLFFNSIGDVYTSDLTYRFDREYQIGFGTESGGDLATRYTLTLGRNASNLSGLSWRIGVGYRDEEVGAIAGASMRLFPGLFASIDYQGIPSRTKNVLGGLGDDRLTISLVSDLSFSEGRVTPAEFTSIGRERGAIAGRIVVEGGRKGSDLSGGIVQVYNNRGKNVGSTKIDPEGNFFLSNLREGVYVVQLDPNELPIELSVKKTSVVAEVASSAVTKLDFPVTLEYGLAGRITDATGQPIPELEVELVNSEGKKISTTVTDQFGLYRLDGISLGKYFLQIPTQQGISNTESLPKREITIDSAFQFDQNLQLPITPAPKEDKQPAAE